MAPTSRDPARAELSTFLPPDLPGNLGSNPGTRRKFAKWAVALIIFSVILNGVIATGLLPKVWMQLVAGLNLAVGTLGYTFVQWAKPPIRKILRRAAAKKKK
jgi:hypothetical protein